LCLRSRGDRCLPNPPLRRIEEAVARPLVEKFARSSDATDREWGSGRDPDSDASATPTGDSADVTVDGDGRQSDDGAVGVTRTSTGVRVQVGGESRTLSRAAARDLQAALGDALADRREFVHTVGSHREDGAYVVERRGADSAGHRKVFDSFAACRRLFEDLPAEFAATDLDAPGVSGGRRHMLAWHFVEHPAFDCGLAGRQPLSVQKNPASEAEAATENEVEVAGD